jgi:hypothetical protein
MPMAHYASRMPLTHLTPTCYMDAREQMEAAMGEARRRKLEGTYPEKGRTMTDDEENQRFLNLPEVRAFAETPEGQRLLRPRR